jgi:hypothetical protein
MAAAGSITPNQAGRSATRWNGNGSRPRGAGRLPGQPAPEAGRCAGVRIVLVLSLAVIGSFVGVLITALQPGHQPWPLVGLVAGGLLGLWLAATQLPRRRR